MNGKKHKIFNIVKTNNGFEDFIKVNSHFSKLYLFTKSELMEDLKYKTINEISEKYFLSIFKHFNKMFLIDDFFSGVVIDYNNKSINGNYDKRKNVLNINNKHYHYFLKKITKKTCISCILNKDNIEELNFYNFNDFIIKPSNIIKYLDNSNFWFIKGENEFLSVPKRATIFTYQYSREKKYIIILDEKYYLFKDNILTQIYLEDFIDNE